MKEKIEEVRKLISQARIGEAIDYLFKITDNKDQTLNLLYLRLREIYRRRRIGTVDYDSFNIEVAEIDFELINFINNLSNEDLENNENLNFNSKQNTKKTPQIELNFQENLILPEKSIIPVDSQIDWVIKNPIRSFKFIRRFIKNYRDILNSEILATIYFDDESPFRWKNKSKILSMEGFDSNDTFIVASGIAEYKGDYKYGIKIEIMDSTSDEYDEDPILSIV